MQLNFDLLPEVEKLEEAENSVEAPFYQSIVTEAEADEALAKLIWAKKKIEEADEKIKAKKQQLQEQLQEYERRLKSNIENYASLQSDLLYAYLENKLKDRDGNVKKGSIKLFNGTIGLKEPRGSVVIEKGKENNLVELLKQLGKSQCINIKETVYKDEISKTFKLDPSGHYFMTDNGDIIQGIEYQKPDKLQLSVTKPKTAKAA